MKELSIEEKAERYNKALINGTRLWECGEITRENYEYIFQELKETHEEKVKRILHSISYKMSFHLRDIFTEEEFQCFDAWSDIWLENQDKNNMGISEATKKKLEDNLNNALEKETPESCNEFLEKQGEKKYSTSQPIEGEFPYINPAETLDEEIENIWENLSYKNMFTATKDGFHEVIVHFYNWIKKQEHDDNTEPKLTDGFGCRNLDSLTNKSLL